MYSYLQLETFGRYHRDALLREAEHERLVSQVRSAHQVAKQAKAADRQRPTFVQPRLAGQAG